MQGNGFHDLCPDCLLYTSLTLTATLTIVLLAADFFLPLRLLGSYFHLAMNGAASAENIFKLLAAEEPAEGDRVPGANTTLKREHVTFGYEKDRTILNDVSFTIPQGSFVSLVGESGCGKRDVYKRQYLNGWKIIISTS